MSLFQGIFQLFNLKVTFCSKFHYFSFYTFISFLYWMHGFVFVQVAKLLNQSLVTSVTNNRSKFEESKVPTYIPTTRLSIS